MEQTKLNFINRSEGTPQKSIVIYQPNEADMSHDEIPISWKVIKNLGKNDSHSFKFSTIVEAGIDASFGNYVEPIEAKSGKIVEAVESQFGSRMQVSDKSTHNPNEFGFKNSLANDSISINCFRDGKLLATRSRIYPGDTIMFRFSDTISIAVSSEEIQEGHELDESLLGDVETRFDLSGISSADIIMTKGGTIENPGSFEFSIENIQRKVFNRKVNASPSWWKESGGETESDPINSAGTPSWWNENETTESNDNQDKPGTMGTPSWWNE